MNITDASARKVLERDYPGQVTDQMVRAFVLGAAANDTDAVAAIEPGTGWFLSWTRSMLRGAGCNDLTIDCMIARAQRNERSCRWVAHQWVDVTEQEGLLVVSVYQ